MIPTPDPFVFCPFAQKYLYSSVFLSFLSVSLIISFLNIDPQLSSFAQVSVGPTMSKSFSSQNFNQSICFVILVIPLIFWVAIFKVLKLF